MKLIIKLLPLIFAAVVISMVWANPIETAGDETNVSRAIDSATSATAKNSMCVEGDAGNCVVIGGYYFYQGPSMMGDCDSGTCCGGCF